MIGGDNASESEWNRRSPGSVDDLDPEGFTLRLAAQTPHDFAPGDRRAGVGCAAVVSASNAQGSGVRHPKASVRVGSHGRRSRHSLVGSVLAALPLNGRAGGERHARPKRRSHPLLTRRPQHEEVAIVVYRPRAEADEKTLTKQRLALHRPDARDDILEDTAAYFQFP